MNSPSTANNNPRISPAFLNNAPPFNGLDAGALEEVASMMQLRAFGKGMTLFHQDMPGTTLYLVAEGFVRLYAIGQTGQEYTYYVYGSHEIFGELSLLDDGYHSATCMTLTPIKTWLLSRENLNLLMQKYPALNAGMLALIARRVRTATKKAEIMAFHDVQGRLAYEMLNLDAKRIANGETGEIPLSQAELASLVGATRESVNKALASMKTNNLIKPTATGVAIADKEGLQKMIVERGR